MGNVKNFLKLNEKQVLQSISIVEQCSTISPDIDVSNKEKRVLPLTIIIRSYII